MVSHVDEETDFFNAMTYDIHGGWSSHAGHNSPLFLSPAGDPDGSCKTGIDYLVYSRGIPSGQINLGLPFWGKKYNATTGGDDERGTYYAELNANIPLADTGITALIHVGRQEFNQAKSLPENPDASYTDWKVGLTKGFDGGLNVGAFYTDTNISGANALNNWTYAGKNIGQSTGTVFIQKTF